MKKENTAKVKELEGKIQALETESEHTKQQLKQQV